MSTTLTDTTTSGATAIFLTATSFSTATFSTSTKTQTQIVMFWIIFALDLLAFIVLIVLLVQYSNALKENRSSAQQQPVQPSVRTNE